MQISILNLLQRPPPPPFFSNLSLQFGFIYYSLDFLLLPKPHWGEILINSGDRMQSQTLPNKARSVICLKLKIQHDRAME